MLLLGVISALLILVVLLQRGRGGGLAGAFGGLGGQSAFGTKAGDVFTKITIGLVTAWVLLAGVSGVLARKDSEKFADDPAEVTTEDDSVSSADGDASTTSDIDSLMDGFSSSPAEPGSDDTSSSDDKDAADGSAATSTDEAVADEAAKIETESATPEKTEAEAAPVDDKGDAEAAPAEPETATATPDNKE